LPITYRISSLILIIYRSNWQSLLWSSAKNRPSKSKQK